ncbi:flagellin [Limnohabitans sp.]|uniref:flagellin N-terminal helical domain-containing protein n=1 Tax=Limnohabitans sp. TaxID=1907725 RepID=UPI0039BCE72B|nr:flagellin FliC [Comamonadaceae bacterium]
MLILGHNLQALRSLHANQMASQSRTELSRELTTGKRVDQAADDVAGMAMSSKFSAQIRGYDQASRNAHDGISLLQTADAAAENMHNGLMRMRELAVQAANDTYSADDRQAMSLEFQELEAEIGKQLSHTYWNHQNLMNGTAGDAGQMTFVVGALGEHTASIELSDLSATALSDLRNIEDPADAISTLASIDESIGVLNAERGKWAATINRLEHAASNGNRAVVDQTSSMSTFMDSDYAQSTAELARWMILQQSSQAMLSQANQRPRIVLALLR